MATTTGAESSPRGVVVEAVEKGSPAEKAGIAVGDRLLSWSRGRAASGEFRSPFDLPATEWGEAPRGEISVRLERAGREEKLVLPPSDWLISVRPAFPPERWNLLRQAREMARTGGESLDEAVLLYSELAAFDPDVEVRAWLELQAAKSLARAGRRAEALPFEERAVDSARGDTPLLAEIWDAVGRNRARDLPAAIEAFCASATMREQLDPMGPALALELNTLAETIRMTGDMAGAVPHFRRALAILERVAPKHPETTFALNGLGSIARRSGDFDDADRWYRRALELIELVAPESLRLAATLNNLGNVARLRGDFPAAEAYHRRALALREALDPDGLDVATSLQNLGLLLQDLGDLSGATELTRRATLIKAQQAPDSATEAGALANLAEITEARGDLATAEMLLVRALAILERKAPEGDEIVAGLFALAELDSTRGDLASAEDNLSRALAIQQRRAPDSLEIAGILNALGTLQLRHGEVEAAELAFRQAFTIRERLSPASPAVASSLQNLAALATVQGDPDGGERLLRRAIEYREAVSPRNLELAEALAALGDHLLVARADPNAAEPLHRRALTIREDLAPESLAVAKSRYAIHRVHLARGELGAARNELCEALRALETQRSRVGGSEESRSDFAADYAPWYREYIDLLIRLGETAEAFHTIERSRARGLLALLAERHVDLRADVPAELGQRRQLLAARSELLRRQLREGARDEAALLRAIREIRRNQDAVDREIRERSPRLAALVLPEPLSLAEAQTSLDPGALLLSFSIAAERGWLFAVSREQARVVDVEMGANELDLSVAHLRARLGSRTGSAGATHLARRLGDRLLSKVGAEIAAASRLIIVPDGPLHWLPFSALPDPTAPGRFLIETKPLSIVSSATVRAELARNRRARGSEQYAAFGDPIYTQPGAAAADSALEPLPATRREVQEISRLAGGRVAAFLGADATEANAKRLGSDVGILHFACHGLIDDRFAMDSSLALSLPAESTDPLASDPGQNGRLEAWEVFEQMRLDAEVVTLSACETATGRELDGEGLVGLVRAFQYAGARSVLASLWRVADESTARLISHFYAALEQGLPKDEALQRAQVDLIDGSDELAAPFHWAAFELIGDWD